MAKGWWLVTALWVVGFGWSVILKAQSEGQQGPSPIDVASELSIEAEATSTWQRIRQVPAYKRRYDALNAGYAQLQKRHEAMQEELRRTLREIHLLEANLADFVWLWNERQQAWRRIYQDASGSDGEWLTSVAESRWNLSTFSRTEPETHTSEQASSPGFWNRYALWRTRLQKLMADYSRLQTLQDGLEGDLLAAKQYLTELRTTSVQARSRITDTARAWRRLYQE